MSRKRNRSEELDGSPLPRKRPRATSEPIYDSALLQRAELTTVNLERHTTMSMSRPNKRQKTDANSTTKAATTTKSAATISTNVPEDIGDFSIYIGREKDKPQRLQELWDYYVTADENTCTPDNASESSKAVVANSQVAMNYNEATAISSYRQDLLGDADNDRRTTISRQGIAFSQNVNLDTNFLPPRTAPYNGSGDLKQPQPDVIYGYLMQRWANTRMPKTMISLFEQEEFAMCRKARSNEFVDFPYITAQWKSHISNVGTAKARMQSARDGATIMNSNWCFLRNAGHERPDPADTAHVSMICNMEYAQLYLHWRNELPNGAAEYEMDQMYEASLNDLSRIVQLRGIVKRVTRRALGRRLSMIKENITGYYRGTCVPSAKPVAAISSVDADKLPLTPPNSDMQPKNGVQDEVQGGEAERNARRLLLDDPIDQETAIALGATLTGS